MPLNVVHGLICYHSDIMFGLGNGKGKILSCDDDQNISSLVKDILESQDYTVDVVSDGQEALNRLKKEKYDLLIMDVHMPNLEGPQALEAIRLIPNGKDLGVIFITSEKMMTTFTRVFELGAVGFIPKPFPAAKLIGEVDAFFAAKNGPK